MSENIQKEILEEMRAQTALVKKNSRTNKSALIFLCALLTLLVVTAPLHHHIYSKIQISVAQANDSWNNALNLLEFDHIHEAKEMTERLIEQHPDYYYGYNLLGSIHHQMGDLKAAEKSYAKATALFPDEENEETLSMIRKAIDNQKQP